MRFAQRLRSFLPFLCMHCSLCFTWCLLYALSVLGFRTPWLFFLCEHVLVVPCSYLSICGVFVCRIEKWMAKGFQIHLRPPPFPAICMIHTWCILKYLSFYLHIPVSLSLSISLVLDSCIPLPIYLLPSIYGSIYSISRSIYHILAQISIMI